MNLSFQTGRRLTRAVAAGAFALVLLAVPAIMPAHAAVEIQEVRSESGVTAWLVEDYTVPIVTVRFAFEGGSSQDPDGLLGLAGLMSGLFDEGAGDLDSEGYQLRLDEIGAEMSFSASSDAIYGEMRMLAESRDDAFEMLRLAVNEPRFDEGPVARIRSQIVTRIRANQRDPQVQGREKFAKALYGDHPYAEPNDGTVESLREIEPEDLHDFHERVFARSNLKLAVVGAIGADDLREALDEVFGGLPAQAELDPVEDVAPELGQAVHFPYELPQASIQLVYPGIEREDPQFFAAYLMNHVLGGGTFSSRLFNQVREERGLAYGIGSYLRNLEHTSSLVIVTSTRAERASDTLAVIEEEIARMAAEGPTEAELAAAKTYVIGAYPINNLDSSNAIARTLLELQLDDLGIDYIERRVDEINSVTVEQARAAAERLLTAEPAQLVIGPPLDNGG